MRCVYSKNKSLSGHTKTEPIYHDEEQLPNRMSLIVAPITVTSKKRNESAGKKITSIRNNTTTERNFIKTQPLKPKKLIEIDRIQQSQKLNESPSIINLLYEDDPELLNEKKLNDLKYLDSTRLSVTQGNSEVKAEEIQRTGLTLTKRLKNLLDTAEST